MNEHDAFEKAVQIAVQSPCAKSKRGVVLWNRSEGRIYGRGFNSPPEGFRCAGTRECAEHCSNLCVHAELMALLDAPSTAGFNSYDQLEMLHVKVRGCLGVPSGEPSCVRCSAAILNAGIQYMWLYEDRGMGARLFRYTAYEFHLETLRNLNLPVFTSDPNNVHSAGHSRAVPPNGGRWTPGPNRNTL